MLRHAQRAPLPHPVTKGGGFPLHCGHEFLFGIWESDFQFAEALAFAI